jgi:hypothetical protein
MIKNLLKSYIEMVLESVVCTEEDAVKCEDDEEMTDEASGAGAVAGYVLPLGASNEPTRSSRKSKRSKK